MTKQITAADIVDREIYARERKARRAELIAYKKPRRVPVGPDATFYFEDFATMKAQVQEMLFIENGGDEQLADELAAYNPLIPQGRELVATLMFDFTDPAIRARELARLTGVEETVAFKLDGETVAAVADSDDGVERTKEDGKTSSIHFLHFPFTDAQIAKFRDPAVEVVLSIAHENYGHMALLPASAREALSGDFAD